MENRMHCSQYADEIRMRYPVHTKEAALQSYADCCIDGNADVPYIRDKFSKVASFYGIELEKPAEKPIEKAATASFGFDGGSIEISRIKDAEDAMQAAAYLIEKRASMTRDELREAAGYVAMGAADTDIDMDCPEMRKIAHIAGLGIGDRAEIEHELDKRAVLHDLNSAKSEFWALSDEVKALSDAEFYKEATLDRICSAIEGIDGYFGVKSQYGRSLEAPEDVVFKNTHSDLLKEASDLFYVPSVDATLSKTALLERADAVNGFFAAHFDEKEPLEGEKLVEKVASADEMTANALLEAIAD